MEPQEYLAEGFDPKKLTIPNLRSVLVEHGIYFPSNASKLQLVEIFNESIKPRAKLLLKQYEVGEVDPLASSQPLADKSASTENINSKKSSSPIGSKRQLESEPGSGKETKKKIKKIRKKQAKQDVSASFSDNSSFLNMDKFEIDENDDIFNGSIDGHPIDLKAEKQTKGKTPTKKILEHFNTSLPASKSFTVDPPDLEKESRSQLNSASSSNIFNNKDGEKINILDDIFDDHFEQKQPQKQPQKQHIDVPSLSGPTIDISHTEHTHISFEGTENEDVVIVEEEKLDGTKVTTLDVKSITSLEDNSLISSSDDGDVKNATVNEVLEGSISDDWEDLGDEVQTVIELEEPETKIDTSNEIEAVSHDGWFKAIFLKSFDVIMIVLPVLFMLCLREIDMKTGYCGFESPYTKRIDLWGKIPESYHLKLAPVHPFIEAVETFMDANAKLECKPCPENGICDFNTLKCNSGYVKSAGIDSLFGFFPLRETCELDYLRSEKMKYFSQYTLKYLHQHNEKPLSLNELHDYLKMTKSFDLSNEEFEEYWSEFVKSELDEDEIWTINPMTQEITLTHKIPSEHLTKTFGNVEKKRSNESKRLFNKSPPKVDLNNVQTKTSN